MVQGVDGLHEPVLVRVDLAAHAGQGRLHDVGGRQPLEHHAGPLIQVAVAPDAGERAGRRGADGAGVVGRRIEQLEFVAAILRLVDAVLIGADEDDDRGSQHAVLAELLRRARGVRGDGLGEFERIGDGTAEGARDQHALPRTGVLDDVVAGDAAQLEGETFADHAGDAADETRIGLREVDGRDDAMRTETRRQARSDAPDILRFDAAQEGRTPFDRGRDDDHAAAGLIGLGPLVRQLAEHLRRSHPQRDRDARALKDIGPDTQPQGLRLRIGHVGEAEEGLVDRIDLQIARLLAEGGHDALREIAVDREVGGEDADAVGFAGATHLEIGRAHRDTQRLGF